MYVRVCVLCMYIFMPVYVCVMCVRVLVYVCRNFADAAAVERAETTHGHHRQGRVYDVANI